MAYSDKLREKANSILIERRTKAKEEHFRLKDKIYEKIPEIKAIDGKIANAGLKVSMAVLKNPNNVEEAVAKLEKENLDLQQRKIDLLLNNGYPAYALKIKYTCENCKDTGRTEHGMCNCLKELLKELSYEQLCEEVDVKKYGFHNFSLDYYPDSIKNNSGKTTKDVMENIYKYCLKYASDFTPDSPSLFFMGGTGLGKTHLSIAIAGYALEKGYNVIYSSAQNLLHKLEKEKFSRGGNDSDDDSMNLVLESDLLILDDLGAEFTTQFTVSVLYNIINSRLLQNKPTIISSNIDIIQNLEERYTERFVSRIMGNYLVMKFQGKDIRIIKRTNG